MGIELHAQWIADQVDRHIWPEDEHRHFLARKARVGLMWLQKQGFLVHVVRVVIYGSFISAKQNPHDIDLILFIDDGLTPYAREELLTRNVSYPQAKIHLCDIRNEEDAIWAEEQLLQTQTTYGCVPVVLFPVEQGV